MAHKVQKSCIKPLSYVLLFISYLGLCGNAHAQELYSYESKAKPLESILWDIANLTDLPLSFSNNDVRDITATISIKNAKAEELLVAALNATPLTYELIDEQILIMRDPTWRWTIHGVVEDRVSGERLIGAYVIDTETQFVTSTNEFGFFSLSMKSPESTVRFSYLNSYQDVQVSWQDETNELGIKLNLDQDLPEVEIRSGKEVASNSLQTDEDRFSESIKRVRRLPAIGGEIDILHLIQTQPGVQRGVDGFGGLHVRGGNADQNLVLFDGVPIYNPYHSLGLFSIFDYEAIRKVNFLKGQFPARYGGRISSVMDVHLKEGNMNHFEASTTVGLIASKFHVEGPIIKNKLNFIVGGRRSHLDPILKNYSENNPQNDFSTRKFNYYFYDMFAKASYRISPKNKFYFSFYRGRDNFFHNNRYLIDTETVTFDDKENQSFNWGNSLGMIRWNHHLNSKCFINTTITHSTFLFNSNELIENEDNTDGVTTYYEAITSNYRSKIQTASGKIDVDYRPNPSHSLRLGVHIQNHVFSPGIFNQRSVDRQGMPPSIPDSLTKSLNTANQELAIYLEDDIKLGKDWSANFGMRFSSFIVDGKTYFNAEPRLKMKWNISDNLTWQSSFNIMTQSLHVLTESGAGFPNDLWVPSTQSVGPQKSWQIDVGSAWQINKKWRLDASFYIKRMRDVISYKDGTRSSTGNNLIAINWESQISKGSGKSDGFEIQLDRSANKSQMMLNYTYSNSTRKFDDINNGNRFPFRYDLRHIINASYIYELSDRWSASMIWRYTTGSRITLARQLWQQIDEQGRQGGVFLDAGERNGYQLPPNHGLDLSLSYKKTKPHLSWSLAFGVYNTYNRKNLYHIQPGFDYENARFQYEGVSLIPVLPYFKINVHLK